MSFKPKPQIAPPAPMKCSLDGCNTLMDQGTEYSFIIVFVQRGHPDLPQFQHPPIEEHLKGNRNAQLFCCCAEHAVAAAHACLDGYFRQQHALDAATVTPQTGADKPCALGECQGTMAAGYEYTIAITFATRGADARLGSFYCDDTLPDNVYPLHECCSLDCALKAAHACIDEHMLTRHQSHLDTLAQFDAKEAADRAEMDAHIAEMTAREQAQIAGFSGGKTAKGKK